MKTVLIIALIFLVVGALLIGAGWMYLQKNPIGKNTINDSVHRYNISEAPQKINITTLDSRVEIRPIEGDEWRVECMDREDLYHTVELVDGVLTIKQVGTARKWYEYIGVFNGDFKPLKLTVYLPVQEYSLLNVHSTSGSISVLNNFTFVNAFVQNTSGSITFDAKTIGELSVKNTSGSIEIGGNVGRNLSVKNTSGSITITGGVGGALDVTNTSGKIEIRDAVPQSVNVKCGSGKIYLKNVICAEKCEITNTSGGIELELCDAKEFRITNTSGSVYASIFRPKRFDAHSTSGSVKVPAGDSDETFYVKTVSGSIKVELVGPARY